jgi:hypothetical protein
VRSKVPAAVSCLLAAACSQLLGIDGRYSRDEAEPTPNHPLEVVDSGAGGSAEQPPMNVSGAAGRIADEAQMPLGLPPAWPGMPPQMEHDAGRSRCANGYKVCGDGCAPMTPEHGCASLTCDPCMAPANARTSCGKDGACDSICNPGFVPANHECVPQTGSGGAPAGAGGAPPSVVDAGSGGHGSSEPAPCDPLNCPTCNRGFEGCCIPPSLDGTVPSRCGCFYLPLVCTLKVPG